VKRRLAKKMLRAEAARRIVHASGRREQARVRLDPSPRNRAYFEARDRWTLYRRTWQVDA
jgi:hypothetical protein